MSTGGLTADAAGDLFGTTTAGTIFAITGSGFVVACFARGTRIATPAGEVAVGRLAVGDRVRTASGEERPIVWLGRRRIDCGRHPNPGAVCPVRVAAGAVGPGMPARDLLLSPDHAVFRGGGLIPARHLVNRSSIRKEAVGDVAYFHVELDRHDFVLAEGLPCES